jgi:hypothetical protein
MQVTNKIVKVFKLPLEKENEFNNQQRTAKPKKARTLLCLVQAIDIRDMKVVNHIPAVKKP